MSADRAADILAQVDRGDTTAAIAAAGAALAGAEGLARAHLLMALASACSVAGRQLESVRAAVDATEAFRRADAREGLCDALLKLGGTLRAAGDHASAIGAFEEAEGIARALDDPARMAHALRSIGVCCSIIGRHEQALAHLGEALAKLEVIGDNVADMLGARLSLHNAHSRQARALPPGAARDDAVARLIEDWSRLAADCARAGQVRLGAMAQGNHAIMLRETGRHDEAIAELTQLLDLYARCGMQPNIALSHVELGHAQRAQGRLEAARAHYEQALAMLRADGSLDDTGEALEGLSACEEALGRPATALAALRELRAVEQRQSVKAAQAAVAQRELKLEVARATQQASQDPLTGLANRRALEQWFAHTRPRADSSAPPLSLLLMDLDHFKQINDRFGHATGDRVLQRMARVMQANCRSADLAVRYGGEEFLLALASVDPAQAIDIAHRLRASVAGEAWDEIAPGLRVSVSIGVALASEAPDLGAALALADQRLYAAKYAGRNQVVTG